MKSFKSEVIDTIILTMEERLKETGKHLIKTDTILRMCQNQIDLTDTEEYRSELLDIGIRKVIQSRLFAHGYYSVKIGYFVNVDECENLTYLGMMINGKDETIKGKIKARNRIKELKEMDVRLVFVPDENNILTIVEFRTQEEIEADLEADAI